MHATLSSITDKLQHALDKRIQASLYRSLQVNEGLIDFCSNDYLGFACSQHIKARTAQLLDRTLHLSGSTGSRSISGNSAFVENLERQIADFHHAEAGLIFNSGYDANIGLFSCIASRGDTIICDELIHASIIDGCRLSQATRFRFKHNSLEDLELKLQHATGTVFVVVESVYSMDGDQADLPRISDVCKRYHAHLLVDEAHATGVFGDRGRGLVDACALEKEVFARIHTFGKAMGCHGAIVLGSETLRHYLINFARSFIFTTALPVSSLASIQVAYEHLAGEDFDNTHLHELIRAFKGQFRCPPGITLIESNSPVQSVIISGNEKTRAVSKQLQENGFDVRAILSPSVPVGKERLRISLHAHNTQEELTQLISHLHPILNA